MIGLLITSFLQGKLNLTTTSTIFSPYVDRVMEESRTAYFSESHGAIPGTNRGGLKTVGGSYWAGHRRSLLKLRKKPKHRATWVRHGWKSQLLWVRLTWRSHWRPGLVNKIAKIKKIGKK